MDQPVDQSKPGREGIIAVLVDVEAGRGDADLAAIPELGGGAGLRGGFSVRIFEHDDRTMAAAWAATRASAAVASAGMRQP